MQDDLLEIICILKRGEKHNVYKIIRKRNYFSLITKFPAKNGESTPLKNCSSARRTATHQEKREFSSEDKLRNKRRKHRRNKSSHASTSASHHTDKKLKDSSNVRLAQQKPKKKSSARVASQHTDKKRKDSSNVRLAQPKPKKKKSSAQVASQHTDKKRKDSSNVRLAQPKPKKKSPAQVARDCARRKEFWKRMQLPRELRAENLALHYQLLEAQTVASPQSSEVSQPESENSSCFDRTSDGSKYYQLQETEMVASPQFSVVSQSGSENSACLDRTSDVSQSSTYLTIERLVVNTLFTAQVQSDLNKLSAEASVEHSKCDDLEIVCTRCLKKGSLTALCCCTSCKSSSYCSEDCQISDCPSHKQLCKSIQSQNLQK